MKQTNNALKYLLAQYRAIFKHAYVKGLVSAVVVTAGFAAATQANAATLSGADWTAATSDTLVVGSGDFFDFTALGSFATDKGLTLSAQDTATESGGATRITTSGEDLTVTSADDLEINANRWLYIGNGHAGGNSGASGNTTVTFANTTVNDNGTLVVTGNVLTPSGTGSATFNTTTLTADGAGAQLLIQGSASGSATVNATTLNATDGATVRLLTSTDQKTATLDADSITISNAAVLQLQGTSGNATVQGLSLTLSNGGVMLTDSGSGNTVQTENFTVENGAFKVINGTAAVSETFQGHTATVQSGGNFLVGASGTWTIQDTEDKTEDNKAITTNVTFATGSNVQVDGNIVVSGGLLTIDSGAGLHATTAAGTGLSGSIVVNEKATGQGLEIDSAVLTSFLKAGDDYNDITTDASGAYVLSETASKDVAGSVILKAGRMTFSDQDQVELSSFGFVSGDATSGSANTIVLSGSNVIAGHDISIAKALTASGNGTGTALTGATLHVSTDLLTLGDGTSTGLTQLSGAGVTKLTIRDGLTVNVADNGFFLFNGDKEAVNFTNSDTTTTSQVYGNLEFTTTTRVPIKGKWDFNGDIKFSPGGNDQGFLIGGNDLGYDTYVTFKGDLINNIANGGFTSILIKDYITADYKAYARSNNHATLDLTQADLYSTGVGLFTLSTSMNGEVKLTGGQLSEILNGQTTNGQSTEGFSIGLADNGTATITTALTGEYDFSKFIAKPTSQEGSLYENKVVFEDDTNTTEVLGGILDINGDISLYTGKDATGAAASTGSALDIGSGVIKADTVTLTNYAVDGDGNGVDTTFAAGTLEASEGFVLRRSDKLVLGAEGKNATISLNAGAVNGGGNFSVNTLDIKSGSDLEVQSGVWTSTCDINADAAGGALVVGISAASASPEQQELLDAAIANDSYVAQFTGDNFAATGTAANGANVLEVLDFGKATFNTMQLADGTNVSLDNGHLLVNGLTLTMAEGEKASDNPAYVNLDANNTTTTAGIALGTATIEVYGSQAVMEFGEVATSALIDLDGDANDANADGSKIAITEDGIDQATFLVDDFGQLKFNFASGTAFTTDDIRSLLTSFDLTDTTTSGYLNLGNADLGLAFEDQEDGTTKIKWDNLKEFVNVIGSQATTDKLMSAQVYGIGASEKVKGHYGALSVDVSQTGITQLALNGPTSLHNAGAFGGYFVVNENTGTELGVKLENGASLNLVNGGTIGAIEGNGTYNALDSNNDVIIDGDSSVLTQVKGDITRVNDLDVNSATEVAGNVAVDYLDLTSTLTTTATNSAVTVNSADIAAGATLTTNAFTVGGANGVNYTDGASAGSNDAVIMGTVNTGTVDLNGANVEIVGGTLTTTDLVADATTTIGVGYDPAVLLDDKFVNQTTNDPTSIYDDTTAYTGSLEVKGCAELNGATLVIDPVYGDRSALVSFNELAQRTTTGNDRDLNAGTLDGSIFVGRNSALGIGSADLATLQAKIARFQTNGSFSDPQANPDGIGAAIYLGKNFTLAADQALVLTTETLSDFTEYYYNTVKPAGYSTLTSFIDGGLDNALQNTVYLGANTAVLVDAGVAELADTGRTSPQAMITLAGAGSTGTVIADGGDIIIDGNVRASTYQVFSNATIKYLGDDTAYSIVTDKTAAHYDDNINVSTENNFLQGVVDTDGKVTLGMHGASDPVYASLVAYARGYNGAVPTTEEAAAHPVAAESGYTQIAGVSDDRLLHSYDAQGNRVYGQYSNYFLQETISTGDGSAAEAVARLATYGGAVQAAITAGASSYDAISGRMGMGATGYNLTVADNTQGAALWVSPLYKSSESDGFAAEGVDYGVDLNLYGVALGADYTLANGVSFGAMFNVGSGDVDGKDAGSA